MSAGSRIRRAWAALCGAENGATGPATVAPPEPGGPEAALARARLDLAAAQADIERLRGEYARREAQARTEVEAAGREAVLRVARRIGPLLSQFNTMRALAEQGREVRLPDLLTLAGKLEKAFAEAGITPVGSVGAGAPFNPKLHQRLSGGDVADGAPVHIRFVGYACGDVVVTKAMVSRKGEEE